MAAAEEGRGEMAKGSTICLRVTYCSVKKQYYSTYGNQMTIANVIELQSASLQVNLLSEKNQSAAIERSSGQK